MESQKYHFGKDTPETKKLIEFTHGHVKPQLPPQMSYVGEEYLKSKFYHIQSGATVSINTPWTSAASGVSEGIIEIFAEKKATRQNAKSLLEQFLGFKF